MARSRIGDVVEFNQMGTTDPPITKVQGRREAPGAIGYRERRRLGAKKMNVDFSYVQNS